MKEMIVDTSSERLAVAQNEVAILKTLNHPNICKYFDSFRRGQTFTIVMEYARFGNLYEYLKGHRDKNNLLSNDVNIIITYDQIRIQRLVFLFLLFKVKTNRTVRIFPIFIMLLDQIRGFLFELFIPLRSNGIYLSLSLLMYSRERVIINTFRFC